MTAAVRNRSQIDSQPPTDHTWCEALTECFTAIGGYEGLYEIGCRSTVLGLERRARICPMGVECTRYVPARVRKPKRGGGRRLRIKLSRQGIHTTYDLATVVLEAFSGPRPAGHYARHINGDGADCRLINLQWAPLPHRDGRR